MSHKTHQSKQDRINRMIRRGEREFGNTFVYIFFGQGFWDTTPVCCPLPLSILWILAHFTCHLNSLKEHALFTEIFVAKMQDHYVFYFVYVLGEELKLNRLKMFCKKPSSVWSLLRKVCPNTLIRSWGQRMRSWRAFDFHTEEN